MLFSKPLDAPTEMYETETTPSRKCNRPLGDKPKNSWSQADFSVLAAPVWEIENISTLPPKTRLNSQQEKKTNAERETPYKKILRSSRVVNIWNPQH